MKVAPYQILYLKMGTKYAEICISTNNNHEFTNIKCCKMSFKAFKMKKEVLKRNK